MAGAARRLVGGGKTDKTALSLPLLPSVSLLLSPPAACACVPLRSAPARFEEGGREAGREGGRERETLDASE